MQHSIVFNKITLAACIFLYSCAGIQSDDVNFNASNSSFNSSSFPTYSSEKSSHNVEINFTLTNGKTHLPMPNTVIDKAKLSCSELPITNGESMEVINTLLPTSPESWCDINALNLPIVTDNEGAGKLYFKVDPSPMAAGIKREPWPEYNIPMIYLRIQNADNIFRMSVITPNEWTTSPQIY